MLLLQHRAHDQRLAQRAQLPVHAGLAEQILEDEDPKVRQRCLELLFESLASDPVVPVLDKVAAHALADEDLGTRARAALALAYLPTWSARAHVVLTACGALGASRVLAEALAAFPPPFGEEAREKGSSELSPNLIRDHQDLLLSLLNARDSVVVTRAAETLGRVADERAVNALLKAQAHPDDAVRLVAQQALRQVHSRHLSLAQGTLALAEHDAATGALSEAVSEGGLSHVDLAETLGSDHGGESHERG